MFLGDVSEERQAEIRRAVEDVMSFFFDRYGVVVPEFTLYASPDRETAAAHYTELTGREPPLFNQGWEGGFVAEGREGREDELLAFLAGWWVTTGDVELRDVLAHEYLHLIQFSILRSAGVSRYSPEWLTEGTAEYNEELYSEHYTGSETNKTQRLTPLRNAGAFRDIADNFNIGWYGIAGLAIDWLVTHSGNRDASLEYWRLLADNPDWSNAFESAFSITVEDFFEAFEEHRTELASDAPHIRGVVLDPDGNTLGGVHIIASAPGNAGPRSSTETAGDGTFELLVPEGSYFVKLGRVLTAVPGRPYGGTFFDLFYSPETGYANTCGPLTDIVVDASGVAGLEIRVLPALLETMDTPPCNEGVPGHYVIESTVFGPDGEPVPGEWGRINGVHVSVHPIPARGFVQGPTGIGPDGKGRVAVPDGRYALEITEYYFRQPRRHLGWYGEGGFTTDRAQATVIEVDGADVTGIEIRLPANPADLPTIE